jgi:hypothetical protein
MVSFQRFPTYNAQAIFVITLVLSGLRVIPMLPWAIVLLMWLMARFVPNLVVLDGLQLLRLVENELAVREC